MERRLMNSYYKFLGRLEQAQSISEIVNLMNSIPEDITTSESSMIETLAKQLIDNMVHNLQSY